MDEFPDSSSHWPAVRGGNGNLKGKWAEVKVTVKTESVVMSRNCGRATDSNLIGKFGIGKPTFFLYMLIRTESDGMKVGMLAVV